MSEQVNITVDPTLVKGIIEKEIRAAITAQLGLAPNLISNVVGLALKQRVQENGTVGDSYYNKYDFIEVLCNHAIRDTAKATVMAWVEEKKPEIEKAIFKELNSQKTAIVKTFLAAISQSLSANFRVDCNLKLESGAGR
jgi:hypothetical protein